MTKQWEAERKTTRRAFTSGRIAFTNGIGRHFRAVEGADPSRVADDMAMDIRIIPAGLNHGRHEIVVRHGLVYEPPTALVDRDIPRLAAVDEVRKGDRRPIRLRNQRDRHPGRGLCLPFDDGDVQGPAKPDAVTGVVGRCHSPVVLARRHMVIKPGPEFVICRKAAAGQNNRLAGADRPA